MLDVPLSALHAGFLNDPVGTHGSRTIMLAELRSLLAVCPPEARIEQYRAAIVDENVLFKRTLTTRKESFRRLRELYALDSEVLVFRALRDLWDDDPGAPPLLALLCATARDPILRSTADLILSLGMGEPVAPQMIAATAAEAFPGRYNEMMLANIGRHAASSWQQSGHLHGRATKIRGHAVARPASVAYALFIGFLCGERGRRLFDTLWCRLLDAPLSRLFELSFEASRHGWLEFRHVGDVVEVSFRRLGRGLEEVT